MKRNYWGYRINTDQIEFFMKELNLGQLRQGWGWNEKQTLKNLQMDEGAKRNLPIYNKVKKGDILLIPRLPSWNEVAIVEATADFNNKYKYEVDPTLGDFGHIFPAKLVKQFVRKNKYVSGDVRSTLKNPSRFWSANSYSEDIDRILDTPDCKLRDELSFKNRFNHILSESIVDNFNLEHFTDDLYTRLCSNLSNEEWEYGLVEGLKKLFPYPMVVERTGGTTEKEHGTDILIKYPSLTDFQYAIAIQVKDYSGYMSDYAIQQISKADDYWTSQGLKLIDKYIIVTKCKKEDNLELLENSGNTKVLFVNELKELLKKIGTKDLG